MSPSDPVRTAGVAARGREPIIRLWLFAVAGLVLLIAVVGAATRLTDSGLSITEWQPILGAIPPLSEADWLAAFGRYQAIPEYQIVNQGMTLAEFKPIFWWEWSHRFLGRLIGIAFAAPFLFFLLKGWLDRALAVKLGGLLLLGGLQGFVGWYMVQSGLLERVDVSQYRLVLHLTLAAAIFALTLWLGLGMRRSPAPGAPPSWRWTSCLFLGLVVLQIVSGAFVAGLDAGLSHNTWPLMDGAFVPVGLLAMSPWYANLFENVMTVQFDHRILAYGIAVWVVLQAIAALRSPGMPWRTSALALLISVLLQVALGIATLLAHVPIGLGLAHQAGAFVVLGLAVWHLRRVAG
jgi:cytochrome c oxidase assembly protein subunit 15